MTVERRPNIVIIITHDTGDYLGCYGHAVATPHLDRFAATGVRCDRAFCTAPQCSPSRASLITGLYPHTNGMMGLAHREWELHPEVRCLPHYLDDAGYRTALFGFQHESSDPRRLGYQSIDTSSIEAADVARGVSAYLDSHPTGPFFVMAGFTETHRPFDRPGYDADPPERVTVPPYLPDLPPIREELGQFQGLVKAADDAVGTILAALDRHPEREQTIVIFTTDHGIAMPRAKGTLFDPGIRTALLLRWPAVLPGGRVLDELLSNVDLLPTLLDAADLPMPDGLHGRSFLPLLRGAPYRPHDHLFVELTWHDRYNPMRGARTDQYKYIQSFSTAPLVYLPRDILTSPSGEAVVQHYYGTIRPAEELYDLVTDPLEMENVATDPAHSGVLATLRHLVHDWMVATNDPLPRGPVAGTARDRRDEPGWGYPFPPGP